MKNEGGLGQFADLGGRGLVKKRRGQFWGGIDTLIYTMDLWCSQKKSTILNIESNHSFQCHCSKPHYLLNHLVFEFVTSLFSQTRQFNWRQHGCCINSIQFLGCFHTCSVKSFSKFLITWILAFYFSQKFQSKESIPWQLL